MSKHNLTRRSFLASSAAAGATVSMAPGLRAFAARGGSRDLLVYVFLRGGMDGLTVCAPYGDANLYSLRPNLAIHAPGQTNGAVDLDGFFGLAPAAAPLLTPYQAGHLAIVHAAGSPDPDRSHFEAMRRIETATPNLPGPPARTGWLGRYLANRAPTGSGALRGLALDPVMPQTLVGGPGLIPTYTAEGFAFPGPVQTAPERMQAIRDMYERAPIPAVRDAAANALAATSILQAIDFTNYVPAPTANYPASLFATRLRNTATILKSGAPIEVIELDYGAWDHHDNQGPLQGTMAQMLDDLTKSLEAFYLDVASELNRVTLVAMSEFGRRADENGSGGTDHGRGGVMFVMGGNVNGGQVHGQWPGLGPSQLDDFALQVTTDYRDVLGEVLVDRLGHSNLSTIFPGHVLQPIGVVR